MRLQHKQQQNNHSKRQHVGILSIIKTKYIFAIAFICTYIVHINIAAQNSLLQRDYNLPKNTTTLNDAGTISKTNNGNIYIHKTNNNTRYHAWTESHSPYLTVGGSNNNIRISFRLHKPSNANPYPSKFLSVVPYMCSGSSSTNKQDLPSTLSPHSILNFTTSIATDLKIVHLGDSLGQQFVQGFDASVLAQGYEANRNVLQEYFYEGKIYSHNCLSVSAPTRGGGISSYWRVTDLISLSNYRKKAQCTKEELQLKKRVGWSMEQSIALVNHTYYYTANDDNGEEYSSKKEQSSPRESFPVGKFDCVIMRIPHGWMDIPDITRERIIESINLSHVNLGVETVIITTLPLNNNVLTANDWNGIYKINEMIRDVAYTWPSRKSDDAKRKKEGGVKNVLVQEFGNFTNQILWRNAQHLGYNVSSMFQHHQQQQTNNDVGWELSSTPFLLDRLPLAKRKWPPSISMVCAQPPDPGIKGGKDCIRNKISTDGMHWCIETLGPRYSASIACLLGCVYNSNGGEKEEDNTKQKEDHTANVLRQCERECNDQFMSINPIDEQWLDSDTTLFAQS